MQTITKTFNVYNYDELSEDIKELLLEKQKEICGEIYCDYSLLEDMEEKATDLLLKYFGEKAKFSRVFYDLGYCQGDGAMIEFELEYYNKQLKIKHNGFYYHELCFEIDGDYLTDKQYKQLKEKIYRMNVDLKNFGYAQIEQDFSEWALDELNEKTFYQNGDIYEG
jgi:hypothetical protein